MSAAGQRWLQRPRPLSQVASPTPAWEAAAGQGSPVRVAGPELAPRCCTRLHGNRFTLELSLSPGGKFGVFICTPTKCGHCVHAEMQCKVPAVTQG